MTSVVTLPTRRAAGHPFDPPAEFARLRADQPITRMRYPDGHVGWLVTSHALARKVLADPRFSNRSERKHPPLRANPVSRGDRPAAPGMFPMTDPPEHSRYRRLLTGYFTVQRMRGLESRITEIVAECLAAMIAAGPPVDLVPAFALPIPSLVTCELLGVPYDDHATFQDRTAQMVTLDDTPEHAAAAVGALTRYMHDLVLRKRTKPGEDMLGRLVADTELTDEELANIGMMLLVAGHETTANMIGLGVFALLEHPEQLATIRTDQSLMDNTVEELLRYLTIVQFGSSRSALDDVDLDGNTIREGETVTLALSAANRDPEAFPDPDALRPDRPDARHHLAFGHGVHQCLGQQLARIEMRVAYSALFDRFPSLRLAVSADQIPLRENALAYGVRELPVTW
ncbi:MAG: cytochrome P450 [Kutzneria sp.]|nr:cytochrome P450 [Kutzneria sp.]